MTPSAADSPAELIISACTVLVHDDQERIGFVEDAAIVVQGGVVEAVTTTAEVADLAAAERVDAPGQVALPGLINCHTHAPMVALRGLAEDLPTEEWCNDVVRPVEANLTARDVELGAWLACAEMIRAHTVDDTVRALRDIGVDEERLPGLVDRSHGRRVQRYDT